MKTKNKFELHRTLFSTRVMNKVSPEEIPVGNTEAVTALFADMEQLEFVNEVLLGEAYPASEGYSEVILTEEWAQSFADAINKKPGFLYAKGHEDAETWFTRAIASGYIVGAKVEPGRLLLRNRLLQRESPENKELMHQTLNEIRAGLLSTSTGDYQKRRVEFDEDGDIVQYAIESVKNQTNALVEHDMHASEATIIASNFRLGSYDDVGQSFTSNKVITDTKYTAEDGVNNEEGEVTMKEHIDAIKTKMKKAEIAEAFEIEVVSDEVKAALKKLEDVEAQVGDLDKFVTTTLADRAAVFKALKDSALREAFKEQEVLEAAETLFTLQNGTQEEVEAEITRLKELSGIKKMQSVIASGINHTPNNADVETGETGKTEQDTEA